MNGHPRLPSVGAVAAVAIARVSRRDDGTVTMARGGYPHGSRRLASVLGDLAGLVAVAYALPLAILAIGIPIALLIGLVIWIVGAL